MTAGVDWDAVARFVRTVQGRSELTKEHTNSIKSLIKSGELRAVLYGITVCPSLVPIVS